MRSLPLSVDPRNWQTALFAAITFVYFAILDTKVAELVFLAVAVSSQGTSPTIERVSALNTGRAELELIASVEL